MTSFQGFLLTWKGARRPVFEVQKSHLGQASHWLPGWTQECGKYELMDLGQPRGRGGGQSGEGVPRTAGNEENTA